jgi:hypothetical protein
LLQARMPYSELLYHRVSQWPMAIIHGAATVESDFSELKWTKDEHSIFVVLLTKGIATYNSRQFDLIQSL